MSGHMVDVQSLAEMSSLLVKYPPLAMDMDLPNSRLCIGWERAALRVL
jgi:hypothetical protein